MDTRTCLEKQLHPQPAIILKANNSTSDGIIIGSVKQERSKSKDMGFYWLWYW